MTDQTLTPAQFSEFFDALWGKTPFPWQSALAERVLADQADAWPEAITLPTASPARPPVSTSPCSPWRRRPGAWPAKSH